MTRPVVTLPLEGDRCVEKAQSSSALTISLPPLSPLYAAQAAIATEPRFIYKIEKCALFARMSPNPVLVCKDCSTAPGATSSVAMEP